MAAGKTGEPRPTPSQTIGPFFHDSLLAEDQTSLVAEDYPGAILISGTVYDGTGEPVPDAMVELWQADPGGHYVHPDAPQNNPRNPRDEPLDGSPERPPSFTGFGRSGTANGGSFGFVTVKPGRVPDPEGTVEIEKPDDPDKREQAPHLLLAVFARGLLRHLVTRVYFPDEEEANAQDPVLRAVPDYLRPTLVAVAEAEGFRLDLRLQKGPNGELETVFFDV